MRLLVVALYVLTVPLANWMIGHVGACASDGPCLLPVWPGLYAPSGVLVVGLALCLRDVVQQLAGRWVAGACVLTGALLSWGVAPPALALASGLAFAVSEALDGLVFEGVRKRGVPLAVLTSGIVGLVVDSALFLLMAFGSLDFMGGQVVGKFWGVLGAAAFAWVVRKRSLSCSFV